MKHLKSFNRDLYQEISAHDKFFNNLKGEKFTEDEIEQIKKIVKSKFGEVDSRFNHGLELYKTSLAIGRYNMYLVCKYEDEWFHVHSVSNLLKSIRYKCDSLKGLLTMIKDKF